MHDLTYTQALSVAAHLIALNDTTVYLRSDEGFPYSKVTEVVKGCGFRISGPTGCYLIVKEGGLTFHLSFDFEGWDKNGTGTSQFNRADMRELMRRLSPEGRNAFAAMLEQDVVPGLTKHADEIREALNKQTDTLDCVTGIIAFARNQSAGA